MLCFQIMFFFVFKDIFLTNSFVKKEINSYSNEVMFSIFILFYFIEKGDRKEMRY